MGSCLSSGDEKKPEQSSKASEKPANAPARPSSSSTAPAKQEQKQRASEAKDEKQSDSKESEEVYVECKGEFMSHIIGPKGATVKEIRAKAPGVQIDIPQGVNPRDMGKVKISGPASSVAIARKEVEAIIAQRKKDLAAADSLHNDAYGEVDAHAKKRDELMAQSKAAYERGDKALAKQLSDQGKQEGVLMQEAKLKAARKVFDANNQGRPVSEMDLHGLQIEAALTLVQERYDLLTSKHTSVKEWVVIPGAGIHSDDSGPKLKPAVTKWLGEKGLKFKETGNGVFTVNIN